MPLCLFHAAEDYVRALKATRTTAPKYAVLWRVAYDELKASAVRWVGEDLTCDHCPPLDAQDTDSVIGSGS